MGLKGARRNLATDKSLPRMRVSCGRAHLERQRRDAVRSPGGVRGLFENAFSDAPIGMRRALEEDQFVLFCQPILNLKTNEVSRYELLLRLPDVEGCEPLTPNAFLYIAERFGLIPAIDLWVVRNAIAVIAAYERAGQRLVLNVNLSVKSIGDPRLAGLIESALVEGGIDPTCLVLEITETASVANLQPARSVADRMHSCGCGLALDNFGAGLASFYYLKNFPFDYLKNDGEFIRGLSVNPVDRLVVQTIVCIAQGTGKKTVAEFVADATSVCLLRDSGVHYAQGYHIGLPRPIAEVLPAMEDSVAG
jgi:EAL domain-containing protein (putative c-di-GMP-specific phosphodiesterase class I)